MRLAVAAYLARYTGQSRVHTESGPALYLTWCHERDLDPLAAQRPHVELLIRWMQEIGRYKPSTVSRRSAVRSVDTVCTRLSNLSTRPLVGLCPTNDGKRQ